jgi:hypothetical protein
VLDALDLLQGFIDGRFVGQQGVGDIEVAFLFGANGRHAIQRALLHPSTDRRLLVLASCAFRDSDSTIFLTTLIRTRARFLPAGRNAVINGALIDKNARIGDGL